MDLVTQAGWPPNSFLGQLSAPTRSFVLGLGRPIQYLDGEDALTEGTSSNHVLLLIRGWFKVVAAMETGREALLAIRLGGDLVGELAGSDGAPRIATVRASGGGLARLIGGAEYSALLTQYPDAALAANRVLVDRLRVATRRQVEFATCTTATRVARVLCELVADYGRSVPEGIMLSVELTQPELAALAGTTEPTVHRILTSLRSQRLIATGYRSYVVLDRDGLARRAAG